MDGVVVLGASGMLGAALVRELASRGSAHVAAGRDRLDVVRLPVSSPTYSIDLAREIVRLAGLDDKVEVCERPQPAGPPARPPFSVLDTTRFEELTGREPRTWQEALAEYLGTSP